jgi:acyl-homoserine lactone acylase PvdQ
MPAHYSIPQIKVYEKKPRDDSLQTTSVQLHRPAVAGLCERLADTGPRARGILAYSKSSNPESPWYSDQTEMFSGKQWLDLPFSRSDIEAASIRSYRLASDN